MGWLKNLICGGRTMYDGYVDLGEQIAETAKQRRFFHTEIDISKKDPGLEWVECVEKRKNELWENRELGADERYVKVSEARNSQVGGGHYTKMKIQPLEYSHANNLGPAEHTVVKYVSRWRDKGGLEDLRKAIHVIELLIEMVEREEKENE